MNVSIIFESEEDANYHLKNQVKSHIEFAKRQIKEYTEDLQKWGAL